MVEGKGTSIQDKDSVRSLARGELPTDPQALIVEIPLTQSPTVLIKRVPEIITEASATQQRASRKKMTSQYQFRPLELNRSLRQFEKCSPYIATSISSILTRRGKALLHEMRAFYLNRKQKRFAKIPEQLDDTTEKLEDRMRNLRRYISKAQRVMLNVASGQFRGKY